MKNKATIRGGIRWGNYNVSWPFVKMEIDGDALTFRYFGKLKAFRSEDIVSVRLYKSITPGIRIFHKKRSYPEHVIFWIWQPEKALSLLREFALQNSPN